MYIQKIGNFIFCKKANHRNYASTLFHCNIKTVEFFQRCLKTSFGILLRRKGKVLRMAKAACHLCPASLHPDTPVQSRLSGLLSVFPIQLACSYSCLCICSNLCLEPLLPPMSTWPFLKLWLKYYFLSEVFSDHSFCSFNNCCPHIHPIPFSCPPLL